MLNVSVKEASYGTGGRILGSCKIEVKQGEAVSLLGRNGVGKTTLMKYIIGLLPRSSGEIWIGEKEIHKLSPPLRSKLGIGYVPQGREIFPRLTVLENIRVAAVATGNDNQAAVSEIMDRFPILKQRPNILGGSLSGGQQQILALARALATKPKILLLDEPTEGVQPSIIDEIAEMLIDLNKNSQISMLVAEQNLDFAAAVTQRSYIMDKGTVVRSIQARELLDDQSMLNNLLGV